MTRMANIKSVEEFERYQAERRTRWQSAGNVSFDVPVKQPADRIPAYPTSGGATNRAERANLSPTSRADHDDASRPSGQQSIGGPLTLRHLSLTLPMPPSVNQLYRAPNRDMIAAGTNPQAKWLTDEQRTYRHAVILLTRSAMRGGDALVGRLEMRLTLYFADHRRADISNRVKAVEDALTHAHAYHDDSQIDRLLVERVVRPGVEQCGVTLMELGA